MLRWIVIGTAAAGLLIAGALTSLASNTHATAGSHISSGTSRTAEAKAANANTVAPARSQAEAQPAQVAQSAQAETDSDTPEDTTAEANDGEASQPAAATTSENDNTQENQGGTGDSGGND